MLYCAVKHDASTAQHHYRVNWWTYSTIPETEKYFRNGWLPHIQAHTSFHPHEKGFFDSRKSVKGE